jgi:hypothetical protein
VSIEDELANPTRSLEYKGFRLNKATEPHEFWSVLDNSTAELDGFFTDLRNVKGAIDQFLERKELERTNFNADGDK